MHFKTDFLIQIQMTFTNGEEEEKRTFGKVFSIIYTGILKT